MARVYISGKADEITFPKPRHLLFFPFFFWLPFLPCHSRALFLLPFVRFPCFNIHSCLIVRYTVTSLKKKKNFWFLFICILVMPLLPTLGFACALLFLLSAVSFVCLFFLSFSLAFCFIEEAKVAGCAKKNKLGFLTLEVKKCKLCFSIMFLWFVI